MKKKCIIVGIIILVLIAISIIQVLINKCFAGQNSASFKLSQVDTKVGDRINIELTIVDDTAFMSGDFVVTYDTTKLAYVSYTTGSIENFTTCANETSTGTIKIAGTQNPAQSKTVTANTSIIVLQFDVLAGSGTTTNIGLQCSSLYTSETEKATTVTTNGVVNILNVSEITGNIATTPEITNATAYLYKKETDTLVDESNIDSNGTYDLATTENGEYYIKIKKDGYLDYCITGIEITEVNNAIKTLNNVELIAGDLDNNGEIELMDLVKLNDNCGTNNNTITKENVVNNYTKKAVEVDINDLGYNTL